MCGQNDISNYMFGNNTTLSVMGNLIMTSLTNSSKYCVTSKDNDPSNDKLISFTPFAYCDLITF